jgi:two-component system, LuxR family, response regulator FixJ
MIDRQSGERGAVREIVVVDGDTAMHDLLALVLASEDIMVTSVADGAACLDLVAGRVPSAILLNIGDPHRSTLDVLRGLKASQCPAPVVVVAATPTIRLAVEAMKCGAADFFERPFDTDILVGCLRATMAEARGPGPRNGGRKAWRGKSWRDLLTPREYEVLVQITSGASNKEVGRLLHISPRTVEVHRARMMEKLGARNAADLVRIVLSDRP